MPADTKEMKMKSSVLVLLALLALVPCTQSMAQMPPAAMPANSVTAPAAPMELADFLASLSDGQSPVPGVQALPSSPKFLSTTCTSSADCLPNQKCCYPCGIPDCNWVCMTVKRCPLIP